MGTRAVGGFGRSAYMLVYIRRGALPQVMLPAPEPAAPQKPAPELAAAGAAAAVPLIGPVVGPPPAAAVHTVPLTGAETDAVAGAIIRGSVVAAAAAVAEQGTAADVACADVPAGDADTQVARSGEGVADALVAPSTDAAMGSDCDDAEDSPSDTDSDVVRKSDEDLAKKPPPGAKGARL
jgi:hypothetical protein